MDLSKIRVPAEFTLTANYEGNKYEWTGSGSVEVGVENKYEDIGYDYPLRTFNTRQDTTITVTSSDVVGKIYIKKESVVRTVKNSREIQVVDFSFGELASARKVARAPKSATFELVTGYKTDTLRTTEKSVIFKWDEELG